MFQLLYTFYVFDKLKISHGDIHTDNIFVTEVPPTDLCYIVEGVQYRFTTTKLVKIYDFDHAMIEKDTNIRLDTTSNITINKIVNYGYAHHIERLMYLGNYMFLCMINPKDVYNIFMEWTIDAYEWVMIPNVFGMSQFADGGLMMTRPYFSSSNYILKISDYKKGEWSVLLNALYYNFINTHKDYLQSNYATARQVAFWNKKSENDKKQILSIAKKYINSLFGQ